MRCKADWIFIFLTMLLFSCLVVQKWEIIHLNIVLAETRAELQTYKPKHKHIPPSWIYGKGAKERAERERLERPHPGR